MKTTFIVIILLLSMAGFAQKDTVYYFGVNGKMDVGNKQEIMKKIDYRKAGKIRLKTYKNTETGWELIYTENMKIGADSVYEIKIKGNDFSGKITRVFKPAGGGFYRFTDHLNTNMKQTGTCRTKVPLIFEGEVTENYRSGNKKSVSVYHNNELVSNQNWLPDGKQLVNDIFYSCDSEPNFVPGMGFMHQQIRQAIKDSKFDLQTVNGLVLIGIVITREGKIGGVQIVKGISQVLNNVLIDAFSKVEGAWIPAKLNGKAINYFQVVPINFIYSKYNFDYLDMERGMMYWMIN